MAYCRKTLVGGGGEVKRKSSMRPTVYSLQVHFDPDKLTCDASPYGIGAMLSHQMEDGNCRLYQQAAEVTQADRILRKMLTAGMA